MEAYNYDELMHAKLSGTEVAQLIKSEHFFELPLGITSRAQAKKIDRILGYKTTKIEQALLKKYRAYFIENDDQDRKKHFDQSTQTWIGLNPQVLQTPYHEILEFLSYLKTYSPQKVVDLGAGYGRVGVVMSAILPEAQFQGFEVVDKRIAEGRRIFDHLALDNCTYVKQNILDNDFELPDADIYFAYDFSDPHDVWTILKRLSAKLYKDRFFVVARGDGIRGMIQLKFPQFWVSHGAIHRKNWSIFSSFCDLSA